MSYQDNRTQSELALAAMIKQLDDEAAKPGEWLASLTSAERKECPVARGFFAFFPDAIALVARHSKRMNDKHSPGDYITWNRAASKDEADAGGRHAIATAVDPNAVDGDGAYEMVCKAWRAMADLQKWIEKRHGRGEKI